MGFWYWVRRFIVEFTKNLVQIGCLMLLMLGFVLGVVTCTGAVAWKGLLHLQAGIHEEQAATDRWRLEHGCPKYYDTDVPYEERACPAFDAAVEHRRKVLNCDNDYEVWEPCEPDEEDSQLEIFGKTLLWLVAISLAVRVLF